MMRKARSWSVRSGKIRRKKRNGGQRESRRNLRKRKNVCLPLRRGHVRNRQQTAVPPATGCWN